MGARPKACAASTTLYQRRFSVVSGMWRPPSDGTASTRTMCQTSGNASDTIAVLANRVTKVHHWMLDGNALFHLCTKQLIGSLRETRLIHRNTHNSIKKDR